MRRPTPARCLTSTISRREGDRAPDLRQYDLQPPAPARLDDVRNRFGDPEARAVTVRSDSLRTRPRGVAVDPGGTCHASTRSSARTKQVLQLRPGVPLIQSSNERNCHHFCRKPSPSRAGATLAGGVRPYCAAGKMNWDGLERVYARLRRAIAKSGVSAPHSAPLHAGCEFCALGSTPMGRAASPPERWVAPAARRAARPCARPIRLRHRASQGTAPRRPRAARSGRHRERARGCR
jgi:hypothetical protein